MASQPPNAQPVGGVTDVLKRIDASRRVIGVNLSEIHEQVGKIQSCLLILNGSQAEDVVERCREALNSLELNELRELQKAFE